MIPIENLKPGILICRKCAGAGHLLMPLLVLDVDRQSWLRADSAGKYHKVKVLDSDGQVVWIWWDINASSWDWEIVAYHQ